jgi:hypothetical protein
MLLVAVPVPTTTTVALWVPPAGQLTVSVTGISTRLERVQEKGGGGGGGGNTQLPLASLIIPGGTVSCTPEMFGHTSVGGGAGHGGLETGNSQPSATLILPVNPPGGFVIRSLTVLQLLHETISNQSPSRILGSMGHPACVMMPVLTSAPTSQEGKVSVGEIGT